MGTHSCVCFGLLSRLLSPSFRRAPYRKADRRQRSEARVVDAPCAYLDAERRVRSSVRAFSQSETARCPSRKPLATHTTFAASVPLAYVSS